MLEVHVDGPIFFSYLQDREAFYILIKPYLIWSTLPSFLTPLPIIHDAPSTLPFLLFPGPSHVLPHLGFFSSVWNDLPPNLSPAGF